MQLKTLLEQAALLENEKNSLKNLITRIGAFKKLQTVDDFDDFDEDIPF